MTQIAGIRCRIRLFRCLNSIQLGDAFSGELGAQSPLEHGSFCYILQDSFIPDLWLTGCSFHATVLMWFTFSILFNYLLPRPRY